MAEMKPIQETDFMCALGVFSDLSDTNLRLYNFIVYKEVPNNIDI